MCLVLNNQWKLAHRSKVAKEDMTVYKVMQRSPSLVNYKGEEVFPRDRFFSPFRFEEYSLGQTIKSGFSYGLVSGVGGFLPKFSVERGIHSLPTIDAANKMKPYTRDQYFQTIIVKCVIPKGARYHEGYWGFSGKDDYIPNIVSNQLTFVEIL